MKDGSTLGWAAQWVEDSLKGETNERVVEFGRNMAMTLRAAIDTQEYALPRKDEPWPEPDNRPLQALAFNSLLDSLGHALASITNETNPAITVPSHYIKTVWDAFWAAESKLRAMEQSAPPSQQAREPAENIKEQWIDNLLGPIQISYTELEDLVDRIAAALTRARQDERSKTWEKAARLVCWYCRAPENLWEQAHVAADGSWRHQAKGKDEQAECTAAILRFACSTGK